MFDFIPLLIWGVMMVFFLHWLINALKMRIKYEISMALAIIGSFTALILGLYFKPFFEIFILIMVGPSLIFLGFFIFINQFIIMKKLGEGENWENTTVRIKKGLFKYKDYMKEVKLWGIF